jgi:hypothetical protein
MSEAQAVAARLSVSCFNLLISCLLETSRDGHSLRARAATAAFFLKNL